MRCGGAVAGWVGGISRGPLIRVRVTARRLVPAGSMRRKPTLVIRCARIVTNPHWPDGPCRGPYPLRSAAPLRRSAGRRSVHPSAGRRSVPPQWLRGSHGHPKDRTRSELPLTRIEAPRAHAATPPHPYRVCGADRGAYRSSRRPGPVSPRGPGPGRRPGAVVPSGQLPAQRLSTTPKLPLRPGIPAGAARRRVDREPAAYERHLLDTVVS